MPRTRPRRDIRSCENMRPCGRPPGACHENLENNDIKMEYVISTWNIPSLPIVGSNARFPVRRIFCVGRNYVEHQKEMGGDGREQPFFFAKSAHDLVPEGDPVHYPPMTTNFHWETELVAVIGTGGYKISSNKADDHVWGYAVGLDMTRRDLQQVGKDKGRPWTFGKDFDQSAPPRRSGTRRRAGCGSK